MNGITRENVIQAENLTKKYRDLNYQFRGCRYRKDFQLH